MIPSDEAGVLIEGGCAFVRSFKVDVPGRLRFYLCIGRDLGHLFYDVKEVVSQSRQQEREKEWLFI